MRPILLHACLTYVKRFIYAADKSYDDCSHFHLNVSDCANFNRLAFVSGVFINRLQIFQINFVFILTIQRINDFMRTADDYDDGRGCKATFINSAIQ